MTVSNQHNEADDRRAGDLLVGASRIAAHISTLIDEPVTDADVYYFRRAGKWPIGKYGAELIASKTKLNHHAEKITRGPSAA